MRPAQAGCVFLTTAATLGLNVELPHSGLATQSILPISIQFNSAQAQQSETRARPRPKPRKGGWIVTKRGAGSRSCGEPMEVIFPAEGPELSAETLEVSEVPPTPPTSTSKGRLDEPTLEIKIPYSAEELISLSFILQDQDYEDVYRLEQLTPTESGTVRIEIPEDQLAANSYRWFVEAEINCPPPTVEEGPPIAVSGGTGKPRLNGRLERDISAEPSSQSNNSTDSIQ